MFKSIIVTLGLSAAMISLMANAWWSYSNGNETDLSFLENNLTSNSYDDESSSDSEEVEDTEDLGAKPAVDAFPEEKLWGDEEYDELGGM